MPITNYCLRLAVTAAVGLAIAVPLASQAASQESVLHSFQGGSDGAFPEASLLPHSRGFYGTTFQGGKTSPVPAAAKAAAPCSN